MTLKSSLVANSTSGGDCSGGTFIDLGENLDTDDGCPLATVSPTALALGTLAANGGPTQTHALLTGSVAIDAGDCVDAFANPVVADQRGVPRPFDGDGTGGPQCDVGAYELGASVDVVDHSLAEGTGGTTIFSFTLTRTGDTLGPASVEATTSDGTAQAPGDYTPLSALLVSFAPGASTATVDVIVAADGAVEADETFTLTLGNPSPGLLIGVGSATGTILDDDVGVAIPTLDEWGQLLLAALVAAIGFAALRGGRAAG